MTDNPRLPAINTSAVAESLPGLARVTATAALNTAGWGLRTLARNSGRLSRAATNRDEAIGLIRDVGAVVGTVGEIARQVADGVPIGTVLSRAAESLGAEQARLDTAAGVVVDKRPASLRDRGQQLLERSRDVWRTEDEHPAYDRILDELAPDEARVLVMLLKSGPQPSVDVRTGGPMGAVSSQLVAPGLNMVGARAGLRHVERVPAYLNNLFRLGLVWFSREALREHLEYQVLEAQPDVLQAIHSVRFAKVVRRSIHLTPFGEDFVKEALVDEVTATSDLPEHEAPVESEAALPPNA